MFWRKKKKTPQELMAAGDYKGAIKGFRELIKGKTDPDPTVLMQMAGAYLKAGKEKEAKEVYIQVGTHYGDRGFFNKAVIAFKKALNITPDDHRILEKLAGYNDKVPKFMIDANILAKLKKDAASHQTGEHQAMTTEELEAASVTQENSVLDNPNANEIQALPDVPATPEEPEDQDVLSIDDTQPQEVEPAPVDAITSHTSEVDREKVLQAAQEMAARTAAQKTKQRPPPPTIDESFEGILDLDEVDDAGIDDLGDEFIMEFGESLAAPPQEPLSVPEPPKPPARSSLADEGKLAQPISRGGMVFKSQKEPEVPANRATGYYESFDDALDNIFDGGGGGADLFGLDDTQGALPQEESTELTMADASPEENAKHWPLFRTMPQDIFMAFVMALETKDYETDEHIVTEGAAGDEMFLIADGKVDIIVTIGRHPTKVATLGEGDFFGEASLLSGEPRNATVKTVTPTNCLLLNRTDLDKLVKEHPSVMASIESIYYTRIQENASRKNEAGN